jgi:hypothetical protein
MLLSAGNPIEWLFAGELYLFFVANRDRTRPKVLPSLTQHFEHIDTTYI